MDNQQHQPTLPEWLTTTTGCVYLSDTKQPEHRQILLRALKSAPWDSWPVNAWIEFATYITDTPQTAKNEHEVRDTLDRWLRSH